VLVAELTNHGEQIFAFALFDRGFSSSDGCLLLVYQSLVYATFDRGDEREYWRRATSLYAKMVVVATSASFHMD